MAKKRDIGDDGTRAKPKPASPPPIPRRKPRYKLVLVAVLAVAGCGGLGYLSFTLWQKNKDLTEDRDDAALVAKTCTDERASLQTQFGSVSEQLGECKSKREAEATEYAVIEKDLERMSANLAASKEELDDLRKQRAEVEKRLSAFRELTEKLRSMIDAGQIDVVIRGGRMVVQLPAEVMFPSGSAELSEDGDMALMKVAISLEQFPNRQFMVAGHTDNIPLKGSEYRNNWELSTARALTVVEFLIKAGLDAKNLVAAGYGEHDPIASNKTRQGRQKNRRIDIVLLPDVEELPALPEDLGGGGDEAE